MARSGSALFQTTSSTITTATSILQTTSSKSSSLSSKFSKLLQSRQKRWSKSLKHLTLLCLICSPDTKAHTLLRETISAHPMTAPSKILKTIKKTLVTHSCANTELGAAALNLLDALVRQHPLANAHVSDNSSGFLVALVRSVKAADDRLLLVGVIRAWDKNLGSSSALWWKTLKMVQAELEKGYQFSC